MSVNPQTPNGCKVEGCERGYWARGLCRTHYTRKWWREHKAAPPTLRPTGTWSRDQADIDPVVVERLLAGEMVPCTAWERRAAVAELVRRGVSKRQVTFILGMHHRQVYRDLAYTAQADTGLTDVGQAS